MGAFGLLLSRLSNYKEPSGLKEVDKLVIQGAHTTAGEAKLLA